MRFRGIMLAFALATTPAAAQVTDTDIDRSLALRESWIGLTQDVAFPGQWSADGRGYSYRKTVPGGFAFVTYDAKSGKKRPSFDQERLAAALGKATGGPIAALRLPFESFAFGPDGKTIKFSLHDDGWQCSLADYVCAKAPRTGQPRAFGVVRDLAIPADNSPRRSPDGKWEAHVENFNIAVRPVGGAWKRLSTDGSDAVRRELRRIG